MDSRAKIGALKSGRAERTVNHDQQAQAIATSQVRKQGSGALETGGHRIADSLLIVPDNNSHRLYPVAISLS